VVGQEFRIGRWEGRGRGGGGGGGGGGAVVEGGVHTKKKADGRVRENCSWAVNETGISQTPRTSYRKGLVADTPGNIEGG